MRGVLGWGVLIVIGIAALVEIGANSATLGTTNSALLRVPAWACVVFGVLFAVRSLIGYAATRWPSLRQGYRHESIHFGWPPTRLDAFSVLAICAAAFAAVEREWIIVGVALFAILVAVVLPRMKGRFELSGPSGVGLTGELIDTDAGAHQFGGLAGQEAASLPQPQGAHPKPARPRAPRGKTRPPKD